MSHLPDALVAMIKARIADPRRRHYSRAGHSAGSTSDPQQVIDFMDDTLPPGSRSPIRDVIAQMKSWGVDPPQFHLTQYADGGRGASTDPGQYELAPPANSEDVARLAAEIGKPVPDDLAQLFAIADGGWGPGYSFTTDRGPGLMSVDGVLRELDDLNRRGPGYTGEAPWPTHLLPLTDLIGMASYDLRTGEIVQFDDHWYDHDKTIGDAFEVSHPSLADFLQQWMMDEGTDAG